MAVLHKFTHRGVRVEVWEKSFRIRGMPDAIYVGREVNCGQIKRLIDTIAKTVEPSYISRFSKGLRRFLGR